MGTSDKETKLLYEFGSFRLDPAERLLVRDGEKVPLTPKVFDTLLALVESSGRLLEKHDLLQRVWPESFVEEGNLARNVSTLRKVLGENGDGQPYIETVPTRGYRFVGGVKKIANGSGTIHTELVDQQSQVRYPDLLQAGGKRDLGPRGTLSARRWLVLIGLAVLTLGTIIYALIRSSAINPAQPEIKSIAVLPLQNLSGDPAQEYFADGMTETLISKLAQIRSLKVISRTSVMSFKDRKPLPPLPEIAQALKVDGVIEGSVQSENGQVKFMIQLIHGPTDTHLWAREYERALTDVLKLQGEMARAIAEEIRIQLTPEERARISSATPVNPAAHEAYLLGRYHLWKHIVDDHKRAISHFERAIQIDPGYAPAYAGLALALQKLGIQTSKASDVEPQARAAAQKALELDDRLAEAYVARGHIQLFNDWDWTGAENSLRRALQLEGNNLDAHYHYSILLMHLGRLEESIDEVQIAERLDPFSHQVQVLFGRVLYSARRMDEAEERLKRAIELEPRSRMAYGRLMNVYGQMGRYAEAIEAYDKAPGLGSFPGDKFPLASLAILYARMGKQGEAQRMLKGLEGSVQAAGAHAVLGNKDEAFRILFRLVEERKDYVFTVNSDPLFDILHSDPRWKELLRRMNLPVE